MRSALVAIGCLACTLGPAALAQEQADKVLQERINQAIDRGVAFLKKNDTRSSEVHVTGGRALTGWTLLECGVPAKDEFVQDLAERVRMSAIDQESTNGTYNLSLALIFLDKLADPVDEPLIESLTVRLMAGQNQHGGWSYPCPALSGTERDRLKAALKERRERLARGEDLKDKKRTSEEALKDMRQYLQRLALDNNPMTIGFGGDNSNTQFAMMALWVARRHELPVEYSLAQVGKRFRSSQDVSGAWGYHGAFRIAAPAPGGVRPGSAPAPMGPVAPIMMMNTQKYPAMTCAGLLALALEKGVQAKTKELLKDALVTRGMEFLSKQLESGKTLPFGPQGAANPMIPEPAVRAPMPPNPGNMPPGLFNNPFAGRDRGGNYYYYLFSLERMAVVYDVKSIGKTDWYLWGAQDLVNSQSIEGSWTASYGDWNADTCFALLFLKRANIAHDLTDLVKGIDRRPATKAPLRNDPLLDLPLILPKEEKKKAAPAKQSSRSVAPDAQHATRSQAPPGTAPRESLPRARRVDSLAFNASSTCRRLG